MKMDITQIFKISTAVLIFLIGLKVPLDKPVVCLSKIGRYYSLDIYLWHFMIGLMISELSIFIDINQTLFEIGLPIVTIIISILISNILNMKLFKS